MNKVFDTVIKNTRVVRPNKTSVDCLDIAIKDGKIARLAPEIQAEQTKEVFDAKNRLAFPGCVDAHMHIGIYAPLAQDAVSESKAAAMGGVTSSLNYLRTGHYYLNRGGPYREFMPEVFRQSEGRFWVDYGFHIAPIESGHIDEMESLITEHGVTSFKIFMFYGGYGLHGRSSQQNDFLMIGPDERYDIAHFEFIMRSAQRLMDKFAGQAAHISVSLHCELAEILNAYTKIVEREGKLTGLHAYSAARPPHSEGLAIWIASYLATFSWIPIANARFTPRSIPRSVRARMSRRCGKRCSIARSIGSSAIMPAAPPSRSGRKTTRPTSGWRNRDSVAPNIFCQAS
jgi:allantoinase